MQKHSTHPPKIKGSKDHQLSIRRAKNWATLPPTTAGRQKSRSGDQLCSFLTSLVGSAYQQFVVVLIFFPAFSSWNFTARDLRFLTVVVLTWCFSRSLPRKYYPLRVNFAVINCFCHAMLRVWKRISLYFKTYCYIMSVQCPAVWQ